MQSARIANRFVAWSLTGKEKYPAQQMARPVLGRAIQ